MKRRSVAGPLLLIAIGGLFLANNLFPHLSVMSLLGRYWPFILIAWGGMRLLEILAWNASGRPLPRSGVSGGEWAGVVFISLVGGGILFADHVRANWGGTRIGVRGLEVFGESYDYTVEAKKDLGAAQGGKPVRVVLEMGRGDTRVVGGAQNSVAVSGRKTVRSMSESDARKAHEASPLELIEQGGQIIVRTNHDRVRDNARMDVDLEITVPKNATVECRGRYGDFEVTDVAGDVEVDSENAGVRLNNIGGNVKVDLRRSDIIRLTGIKGSVELRGRGQDVEVENAEGTVTVNGSYSGDLSFRNITKALRFESSQTDLRVEKVPGLLSMSRGELTLDGVQGVVMTSRSKDLRALDVTGGLEVTVDRGDLEVRATRLPLAKIDVKTRSGNIDLALAEGAKFDLRASTDRGEVENDFGGGLKVDSAGRRGSITGTVGQGAVVAAHTDRGSVNVRRATADSTPRQGGPSSPGPSGPGPKDPPAAPAAPKGPGVGDKVSQ